MMYKQTDTVVTENRTGHQFDFPSFEKAKKTCKSLNLGGGFDGWTPNFFMNRIVIKWSD